ISLGVEEVAPARERREVVFPRSYWIRTIEPHEPADGFPQTKHRSSGGRSGNTRAAQPSPAAATTHQFVWLRETSSRNGRTCLETDCWTALTSCGGSSFN